MLYQLGSLSLDTYPFSIEEVERQRTATFAQKDLLGRLPTQEFMGEGEDVLTLRGQLLPLKLGGLSELETLYEIQRKGAAFFVMRGDGVFLGWYVLVALSESHAYLTEGGIPQVLAHEIRCMKTEAPTQETKVDLLQAILGLFN